MVNVHNGMLVCMCVCVCEHECSLLRDNSCFARRERAIESEAERGESQRERQRKGRRER